MHPLGAGEGGARGGKTAVVLGVPWQGSLGEGFEMTFWLQASTPKKKWPMVPGVLTLPLPTPRLPVSDAPIDTPPQSPPSDRAIVPPTHGRTGHQTSAPHRAMHGDPNLTFPPQLRCDWQRVFFGAVDFWGKRASPTTGGGGDYNRT